MSSSLTVHQLMFINVFSKFPNCEHSEVFRTFRGRIFHNPAVTRINNVPAPPAYIQSKTCQFEELYYASGLITIMGASVG